MVDRETVRKHFLLVHLGESSFKQIADKFKVYESVTSLRLSDTNHLYLSLTPSVWSLLLIAFWPQALVSTIASTTQHRLLEETSKI